MFVFIPKRYDLPKWQAPVIPKDHAFQFIDGTRVENLYELKQALGSVADDVLQNHIHDGRNDVADWVKSCLGDTELSELLRSQTHRWGLIVALERHLMRTLNLPTYVAQRWLGQAATPFKFISGETVNSLSDLAALLPNLADETIAYHYERYPNDLSSWIAEAVGDYELADLFAESTNRLQMINYLKDHLAMLTEAAQAN